MRVLLLASALLLAFMPAASASDPVPDAGCDTDDDLYNHCHVGDVNTVTGPRGCVGVNVKGEQAECIDLEH